jgi:hypothetical protein
VFDLREHSETVSWKGGGEHVVAVVMVWLAGPWADPYQCALGTGGSGCAKGADVSF